jgi:hypothetical protein
VQQASPQQGSGGVRDLQGQVPLEVVVWLEQHPTSALACALAVSAPNVRWHFRLSPTLEVVLRGNRVYVTESDSGRVIGSARVAGARSAADFDRLPNAFEPPPFTPPEVTFPARCGFASDLDGRVARFHPPLRGGGAASGPGVSPRFNAYERERDDLPTMVTRLEANHRTPAHPLTAFACRVRDLVVALAQPEVVGPARLYTWFEDERVIVWPAPVTDLPKLVVSALHTRGRCLGCSRHDPRDALARGTYAYAPSTSQTAFEAFVREDVPSEAMDIASVATLLGRSPAELAATQFNLRFADAARVDLGQLRRAT